MFIFQCLIGRYVLVSIDMLQFDNNYLSMYITFDDKWAVKCHTMDGVDNSVHCEV